MKPLCAKIYVLAVPVVLGFTQLLAQPCADYTCDSLAVRAIFSACGLDTLDVKKYTEVGAGRIVTLRLLGYADPSQPRLMTYVVPRYLDSIPPEIGRLTALTTLDLSFNQITRIAPEISGCVNLCQLNLSYNQLTSLPPAIDSLRSLTLLNLTSNRLDALPPGFEALTSLVSLSLADNYFAQFPEAVTALDRLQGLSLAQNRLTAIPSSIGSLRRLHSLHLWHNRIAQIPSELGNLDSLATLLLEGNRLSSLPIELATLSALTCVCVDSNQLCDVPAPVALWLDSTATNTSSVKRQDWRSYQLCAGVVSRPIQLAIRAPTRGHLAFDLTGRSPIDSRGEPPLERSRHGATPPRAHRCVSPHGGTGESQPASGVSSWACILLVVPAKPGFGQPRDGS